MRCSSHPQLGSERTELILLRPTLRHSVLSSPAIFEGMKLTPKVADGVHQIEDAYTNWFLVEGDDGITIVDAGMPGSWKSLHSALNELGLRPGDIKALLITHGHGDHLGFAERARNELRIPVWIHELDARLTGPQPRKKGRWRGILRYGAKYPRSLPIAVSMAGHRAWWPEPIAEVSTFTDGTLPVPGKPRVVFTPGHTPGHCVFHFPDRDCVIAGDALVTLNPFTGGQGPQIVAAAATDDPVLALESLDAIADTEAKIVLVGHGDPWTRGARSAVEEARAVGIT